VDLTAGGAIVGGGEVSEEHEGEKCGSDDLHEGFPEVGDRWKGASTVADTLRA
jgi:hypothetical protein